jgi:hypothetical protein
MSENIFSEQIQALILSSLNQVKGSFLSLIIYVLL